MTLSPNGLFANRYRIGRYLGRGSYGEVHAAADTHQDDRVVALKLLDPNQLDGWDWGEASLLTRLQSEYVLSIYNADVWDGVPYLATELATQGSLEHAEALPRLWVRDVLKAVGCAARGLARVHDARDCAQGCETGQHLLGCQRIGHGGRLRSRTSTRRER